MLATKVNWIDRSTIVVEINGTVVYDGEFNSAIEEVINNLGLEVPPRPERTDVELAVELHDTLCRLNHTDMCGWYYETDDDFDGRNGTRARWLKDAKKVRKELPDMDSDKIIKVVQTIRGLG